MASGLEILGALAASIELVKVCAEITAFLKDVAQRTDDQAVSACRAQIASLCDLANKVEQDESLQTEGVEKILLRCQATAESIQKALPKRLSADDGSLSRVWNAAKGRFREKKITNLFDKLEQDKGSLGLHLQVIQRYFVLALRRLYVTKC